MQFVNERNENGDRQDHQEDVTKQEIRAPQRHLDDFHDKLTSRLGHGRVTKATAVPFTRPPCTVCFVVLEFTRKEDCNKDLLDSALNGNDSDDAKHCMGCIPKLKEPLGFVLVNHL